MQLDLFLDSRDTILVNDLVGQLLEGRLEAARDGLNRLREENPAHPDLAAFDRLVRSLGEGPPAPPSSGQPGPMIESLSALVPAANRLLGPGAPAFLRPWWQALARTETALDPAEAAPVLRAQGLAGHQPELLSDVPAAHRRGSTAGAMSRDGCPRGGGHALQSATGIPWLTEEEAMSRPVIIITLSFALATGLAGVGTAQGPAPHGSHGGTGGPAPHALAQTCDSAFEENIRDGRGFGLAFVADQQGYPGPLHVLELKDRLGLSREQEATAQALLAAMFAESRPGSARLLDAEARLRRLFGGSRPDEAAVRAAVTEVERARADVRLVHLMFHLKMRDALTDEQRRIYREVRWGAPSAPTR